MSKSLPGLSNRTSSGVNKGEAVSENSSNHECCHAFASRIVNHPAAQQPDESMATYLQVPDNNTLTALG